MSIAFEPVRARDLPMLNRWLEAPHVARWWGDGEAFDQDYLADPQSRLWLVSFEGRPFGWIQDYAVHGFGPHHFDHLPMGARGMDQFIGEADMLDRGHGSAFVRAHAERLLADGAPAVGTDPHPDNGRAIRAYEKAGFGQVGAPRGTQWGLAQLMERWPSAAAR